jgi:hypothetical protein
VGIELLVKLLVGLEWPVLVCSEVLEEALLVLLPKLESVWQEGQKI